MATVAAFNALDAVIVRVMTRDLHPFVIGFFRALFGLAFVLPWIVRRRALLRSHYRFRHVLRAALKLASLIAFFAAIAAVPLADVTAMMFTAPIFVTIGAWLVLGEPMPARRVVAVAIGFAGVLVVARPGRDGLDPALALALAGAVLAAVILLMLKVMSRHDATDTLVAWNLILTPPLAAIPAALYWTTPEPALWPLLAAQGAMGALAMTAMTKAMSMADAGFLAPIDFLRLPFVAILSFALFGEAAGLSTWLGAGIIFAAALAMQGPIRFWPTRGM